jgi:hypothetical protein
LGVPEEDWSQLRAIAEIQGDAAVSAMGMRLLCVIRADAIERKLVKKRGQDTEDRSPSVHITSFPVEYSTRNLALVGNYRRPSTE